MKKVIKIHHIYESKKRVKMWFNKKIASDVCILLRFKKPNNFSELTYTLNYYHIYYIAFIIS